VTREAVGVDVGGTKIAALRVGQDGRVLARRTTPTPATDQERVVGEMIAAATALRSDEVAAVGVGAAGLVDREGTVRYSPNIAWRDMPVRERMEAASALPCVVENDASMAAWGEFRVGAGANVRDLLLVAAGTGIGGGIVTNGSLFVGSNGFAAEIGHVIVDPDGPLCGCGNKGCWEQFASGRAITRAGREAVREYPLSALAVLSGGDPDRVEGELVTRAAVEGDDVARGILAAVGRRLGRGIAGLVNVLDPEAVVLGGGVADAGDLVLEPARAEFLDALEAPASRPEVPLLAAKLGNDAGAIGAGLLALEKTRR
jgi:glucokinase